MNASDGEVRPVDLGQAEDTLIVRPDAEVEVRRVPPGGAAFVVALGRGRDAGRGGRRGDGRGRSASTLPATFPG